MGNSKAPKPLIGRLRRVLITTCFDESLIFPPGWEVWRGLITRFHLWEIIPFAAWTKIVTAPSTRHIRSPIELTTLTFTEAFALDYDCRRDGNLVLLWQSALCFRDEGHIRPRSTASGRELRISELVMQHRVDSVEKTHIHSEWDDLRRKLLLPPDFDTKLPLTKTNLLACTNAPTSPLESFLALGAKINNIRSVGSTLRCVSSWINSYVSFCTLLRKPIPPPTEDTVLSWSSTFAPGKTFRNYVIHLKKAFILAGHPAERHSPVVRTAAAGLMKAKRGSFQFPNFVFHKDLFKIFTFLSWGDAFSLLAFISYLFSLRAPIRDATT